MNEIEWQRKLTQANQSLRETRLLLDATRQELRTAQESIEPQVQARTEELRQQVQHLQKLLDPQPQGDPSQTVPTQTASSLTVPLVHGASLTNSKSEFLANMSHEIRTPLTAISGYADLLAMPNNRSAQDVAWARQIQRSAKHLKVLLDDIFDLAKVESGRLTVECRSTNLASLIEEVTEMFRPQIAEMLLGFRVNIDPDLPPQVLMDATRTRQILMHLISNAVKFTEKGKIQIDLQQVRDSSNPPKLQIRVSDTGMGMTQEQIQQLFRPFEKLQERTIATPGTGLGMAITKRLIDLMGGKLEITSQPGVGSCVTVVFPFEIPDSEAKDDSEGSETPDVLSDLTHFPNFSGLQGRRVLLAEDNPVNVSILTHFLHPLQIQLTIVTNGVEVVRTVLQRLNTPDAFEVILMDMQMPVMSGFEATVELRKRGVKTPIIACSAFALKSEKDRCRQAGCDFIVSKPINRKQLIATLLQTCPVGDRRSPSSSVPAAVSQGMSATSSVTLVSPSEVSHAPSVAPSVPQGSGFTALVQRYRVSLGKQLATLEAAEARNDASEVVTIAHRLSGTAGNYGYMEITKAASLCELKIRQGSTLQQIHPDLERLKTLIASVVAQQPTTPQTAKSE